MAVVIAAIPLAMAVMVDMAAMEVTEAMTPVWAPLLMEVMVMDIAAMAAMVTAMETAIAAMVTAMETAIAAMDMGMVMERDTAVGNILFINYI